MITLSGRGSAEVKQIASSESTAGERNESDIVEPDTFAILIIRNPILPSRRYVP